MASRGLTPGGAAWVPSGADESWKLCKVVDRSGSVVTLEDEDGHSLKRDMDVDAGKVLPANAAVVSDMTGLNYFHVPGILHNIKLRSVGDEPYTFLSGSVLVAVNPLRRVSDPKGTLGKPSAVGVPHPYAIAESAYQQMVFGAKRALSTDGKADTPINQSVIVGGESGAGKTESSKYVLKHLVARQAEDGGDKDDLDQRLIESNPILEAFGNSATKRNHNSSRFGKFMKLHYTRPSKKSKDKTMRIFGASVDTYLLERSRVTSHVEGERTYHVFYQLVHGAGKKLRKRLDLDGDFAFLTPTEPPSSAEEQGGGGKGKGKSAALVFQSKLPSAEEDKENFKALCKALKNVGVGASADEDEDAGKGGGLFEVLAAILHLGNVQWKDKDSPEGPVAVPADEAVLERAAKLLDVKSSKLLKCLTEVKVKAMNQEIVKRRDSRGAKFALDAVVKYLYVGVFDWLVSRITASLSAKGSLEGLPFIGVLDIFGFEVFRVNDFEQLLINFTNEALQSCFNEQIFQAEASLYEREGLLVDDKDRQMPPDNLECVALLQGGGLPPGKQPKKDKEGKKKDKENDKPASPSAASASAGAATPGILPMIDSEGKNPSAHDDKFCAALHRTFKGNAYFPAPHPRDIKSTFIVKHYAGEVKYTVGTFLTKNVDSLPGEVGDAFSGSGLQVLEFVFKGIGGGKGDKGEGPAGGAARNKMGTITGKFRAQIEQLIQNLNATRCSFIRCIKPNAMMTRGEDDAWFNPAYVMPQLINLSIPQTAEVLRGGLPTRIEFQMFIESYAKLLPKDAVAAWKTLGKSDDKLFVKALFYAFEIDRDSYKLGITRVFFKAGMLDKVNDVLNGALESDKLEKKVVKRFKQAFSRALWRRLFAKALAVRKFEIALQQSRDRAGAASILQRLARRKLAEMEAKEELSRLRAEKRQRDIKEAEMRAEEEKKRAKELKKQREAASDKDKERLDLEEQLAKAKAHEQKKKAQHMSLRQLEFDKAEKELRRSVRMSLRGPTGLKMIEDKRRSLRASLARGVKPGGAAVTRLEKVEEEEEDERPLNISTGVAYAIVPPPQPKPQKKAKKKASGRQLLEDKQQQQQQRSKQDGKDGKDGAEASEAREAGDAPERRGSGLNALMCFNKFFKTGSFKRKEPAPDLRRARSDPQVRGKEQGKNTAVDEAAVTLAVPDDVEDEYEETPDSDAKEVLMWKECLLNITGYQVRFYADSEKGKDGEVKGKGSPAVVVQIDDTLFTRTGPAESTLTLHHQSFFKQTDLVRIMFDDDEAMNKFSEIFDRNKRRYDNEMAEAEKFEQGDITPAMIEFQQLFERGFITEAELEMAIFQAQSAENEQLAMDVGDFSEDGFADYKIKCPDCQDVLFNLPMAPLEACPTCGCVDLQHPEDMELEARVARVKREEAMRRGFTPGAADPNKQDKFPFLMMPSPNERLVWDKPTMKGELDRDGVRTVHFLTMEWHRQVGDDPWEDFVFTTTWDDFKLFYTDELLSSKDLGDRRKKMPEWPAEDNTAETAEAHAKATLAILQAFIIKLLKVISQEHLFDIKPLRRFLGAQF